MKCELQLAARDQRMVREPKQLLHADVERRCARCLVIDGVTISRGRLEMRRSLFLQAPLRGPGQQRIERRPQVIGADLGELRLAVKVWGKPLSSRPGKRLIGQVRPFVLSGRAQETDPLAELDLRLAPRQPAKTKLCDAVGQKTCRFLVRDHREGLVCEHNGIEAADTARPQRAQVLIEFDLVRLADAFACGGRHVRFIGCRREQNARRRRRS